MKTFKVLLLLVVLQYSNLICPSAPGAKQYERRDRMRAMLRERAVKAGDTAKVAEMDKNMAEELEAAKKALAARFKVAAALSHAKSGQAQLDRAIVQAVGASSSVKEEMLQVSQKALGKK